MINENIWSDNQFISFLYDYYTKAINPHRKETKLKKVPKYNHIPFFKKVIEQEIDYTKNDLLINKHLFIDQEFKQPNLSFSQLWNFCKFVRYAEKTIFLKNTPDNCIYVDSDLYDQKSIKFSLKDKEKDPLVECLFELETIHTNKDNLEVIKLTITRQYGKAMTNIFHIVDGDVKYNDSSDILLIETINHLLREKAIELFEQIIFIVDQLSED